MKLGLLKEVQQTLYDERDRREVEELVYSVLQQAAAKHHHGIPHVEDLVQPFVDFIIKEKELAYEEGYNDGIIFTKSRDR